MDAHSDVSDVVLEAKFCGFGQGLDLEGPGLGQGLDLEGPGLGLGLGLTSKVQALHKALTSKVKALGKAWTFEVKPKAWTFEIKALSLVLRAALTSFFSITLKLVQDNKLLPPVVMIIN